MRRAGREAMSRSPGGGTNNVCLSMGCPGSTCPTQLGPTQIYVKELALISIDPLGGRQQCR